MEQATAAISSNFDATFDPSKLDLSTEGVRNYLASCDPGIEKAVRSMEAAESWTMDRVPRIQEQLEALGVRIESDLDDGKIDFNNISEPLHNELIVLSGYVSSGKALRLLLWIDQSFPDFVARTLVQAQYVSVNPDLNPESCRLLVERFQVLERMHLLSRVFAEPRLSMVQDVIRMLRGDPTEDELNDEATADAASGEVTEQ